MVKIKEYIKNEDAEIIAVCAETEAALGDLEPEEQQAYLEELGVSETGKAGTYRVVRQIKV